MYILWASQADNKILEVDIWLTDLWSAIYPAVFNISVSASVSGAFSVEWEVTIVISSDYVRK